MVSVLISLLATADVLAAAPLPRGTVLEPHHLEGPAAEVADFVGLQTARPVMAGRTVALHALEEPDLVRRQQSVTVAFRRNGLSLSLPGRALSDGAAGDMVRVRIKGRRETLSGIVTAMGRVEVGS